MAKKKTTELDGQLCFDLSTNANRYVVQANDLVLAKQSLKLNSAKIMRAIIMQIEPEDDDFKTYRVSIPELAKLLNIDDSNLYRNMHDITTDILKNPVELKPSDYIVDGEKGTPKRYAQFPWVDAFAYDDKGAGLLVKINPVLKPYLLSLKGHYTQYKLEDILQMRSVYALRIYEMLQEETLIKFLPKNGISIDLKIDDIRRCCACEDKYLIFTQFKERVLDTAVKEINRCTSYVVTYEPVKNGRSFDTIRFRVNAFYH